MPRQQHRSVHCERARAAAWGTARASGPNRAAESMAAMVGARYEIQEAVPGSTRASWRCGFRATGVSGSLLDTVVARVAGVGRVAVGVGVAVVPTLRVAMAGPVGVGVGRGECVARIRAGAVYCIVVHGSTVRARVAVVVDL